MREGCIARLSVGKAGVSSSVLDVPYGSAWQNDRLLRQLEHLPQSDERGLEESITKLVETRVTSGRSGCGMSLAIGMDDPEFLLNRGTERREVAIAE